MQDCTEIVSNSPSKLALISTQSRASFTSADGRGEERERREGPAVLQRIVLKSGPFFLVKTRLSGPRISEHFDFSFVTLR